MLIRIIGLLIRYKIFLLVLFQDLLVFLLAFSTNFVLGFFCNFLIQNNSLGVWSALNIILSAVVLWDILFRGQQAYQCHFLKSYGLGIYVIYL